MGMPPTPQAGLRPGFADPVQDAQSVFRAVMWAMSRPALPIGLRTSLVPPAPLSPSGAAILLALADYETSIWLDAPLRAASDVTAFLSFHTGARIVADQASASFVVASVPDTMPALSALAQGTPEYPDRSATVIVQVAGVSNAGLTLEGPGVKGCASFGFSGMPKGFADELQANRATFPCGVDVVLAGPSLIAALPRSVRVRREG